MHSRISRRGKRIHALSHSLTPCRSSRTATARASSRISCGACCPTTSTRFVGGEPDTRFRPTIPSHCWPRSEKTVRGRPDRGARPGPAATTKSAVAVARGPGRADSQACRRLGAGRLESDTGQFSLAGSQAKTALYRVNDRWGVPDAPTPTTHIIKPETGRIPHIAANEHFCLQLARQCRLPAALSEAEVVGGIPVIIVERFDRIRAGGIVRRVHQEDMCQALATREKYQQSGGPGIFDIMELLQFSDRPASIVTASCARRCSTT